MRVGPVLVLLLTIAHAIAQQTGRIEGRVLTPDGNPVPKASVRLVGGLPTPSQKQTAYVENTSSDGRFTVEGMVPGTYTAVAQRIGYISPNQNQPAQRPFYVTVTAGETKPGVVIQLVPLASISGTVTDEDGDAVPGAQVRLLRYMYLQGTLRLQGIASATADDRGQFRLPNVQPGRYYLAASPSPAGNFSLGNQITEVRGRSAQESNLPTFYPSSADARGATLLEVKSSAIENLRVRMMRGRMFAIKGTVTGFNGGSAPGRRPSINVIPKGGDTGALNLGTQVRPAGDFETAAVPPGQYTVLARFTDPATPTKVTLGRAEVTVTNANVEGITLRMSEGMELTGKMTIDGIADMGSYMAGVTANRFQVPNSGASVQQPSRMPMLMLLPAETIPISTPPFVVQDDGSFRAQNVAPMKYSLIIQNLPPGSYVKSLRLNGQATDGNTLDFSGSGATLDMVLSTKGASLSFTAPDGVTPASPAEGPPAAQMITVWRATPDSFSPTGGVQTAFLTPQGNAGLRGLAPGDYFAAMWEETPSQELIRIPDFLARFNTQAARVTLKEGESGTVQPKVISRAAVEKEMAQFP
jgi:hypothetical protein